MKIQSIERLGFRSVAKLHELFPSLTIHPRDLIPKQKTALLTKHQTTNSEKQSLWHMVPVNAELTPPRRDTNTLQRAQEGLSTKMNPGFSQIKFGMNFYVNQLI